MTAAYDEDFVLQRATALAQGAGSKVKGHQLGWVLAHLRRHQDPGAIRTLTASLTHSPFAWRFKSSRKQLETLDRIIGTALSNVHDWRTAAAIVGWAKRLHAAHGRY